MSPKKLKSSAVDAIAECPGQREDLVEGEEVVLNTRDDHRDNRGIKNKLHEFLSSRTSYVLEQS